ncbi:hypothetical protein [Alkalicoccus luteus]|uniref:Uncharacterized protein n=1 Tax=Alkalicoccus luteus TaxID=1237094 RepID=A0A969PRU6_9BACI|nr:hypothetical protein [Alkalicoccus luteus]NJP39275.1 hypothetical protein [Alkalicoccus luteus]
MRKRDLFRDMKQLVSDLKTQDRSTVIRSEEKQVGLGKGRPVLKKESIFRAKVGITDDDVPRQQPPRNRLRGRPPGEEN